MVSKKSTATFDKQIKEILERKRKLDLEKILFLKQTKLRSLTLSRQSQIARSVGAGAVNLEFKRIRVANRKLRSRTLPIFKKASSDLDRERLEILKAKSTFLKPKVKPKPIVKKKPPISNGLTMDKSFMVDTSLKI